MENERERAEQVQGEINALVEQARAPLHQNVSDLLIALDTVEELLSEARALARHWNLTEGRTFSLLEGGGRPPRPLLLMLTSCCMPSAAPPLLRLDQFDPNGGDPKPPRREDPCKALLWSLLADVFAVKA